MGVFFFQALLRLRLRLVYPNDEASYAPFLYLCGRAIYRRICD